MIPAARMDPAGESLSQAGALPALESETVAGFLSRVASGSPTPGGGASAALAGALAAALVGMVCRVTAHHDASVPGQAEGARRADELRQRLTALIGADAEAYQRVLEAGRLPAPALADALEPALAGATRVPLEVAACSGDVLALCEALADRARRSVLGDLGVAACLAWSALESAALIARINLKRQADRTAVGAQEGELERLVEVGAGSRERLLNVMAARA